VNGKMPSPHDEVLGRMGTTDRGGAEKVLQAHLVKGAGEAGCLIKGVRSKEKRNIWLQFLKNGLTKIGEGG